MPDPTPFDRIADQLEQSTSLDRLESRGTLRIALKDAGFDARSVRVEEFRVVLERLLPRELVARGIDAPETVVARLIAELASISEPSPDDSPESVFRRLGGD